MVDNDIDDENNDENMTEVFKTKHAILTHDVAISIVNRYLILKHKYFFNIFFYSKVKCDAEMLKKYLQIGFLYFLKNISDWY